MTFSIPAPLAHALMHYGKPPQRMRGTGAAWFSGAGTAEAVGDLPAGFAE